MRFVQLASVALLLGAATLVSSRTAAAPPPQPAKSLAAAHDQSRRRFDRVFIIILENEDYGVTALQPYFRELMTGSAVLTDYHALVHPSQPNYLAIISGSTWGLKEPFGDRTVNLEGRHLGDLLEEKGYSWKSYAEGYPGKCYLEMTRGLYARRHEPFLSFRNIQQNPARCARVVDAKELDADIASGSVPQFALYVPDNRHNGHDTNVAYAADWLKKRFGPLLADPRFMRGTLFVLTFDESARHGNETILTLLIGDSVVPGRYDARYDHYDLLRTIEDAFGLGTLGREDSKARDISGMWRK